MQLSEDGNSLSMDQGEAEKKGEEQDFMLVMVITAGKIDANFQLPGLLSSN